MAEGIVKRKNDRGFGFIKTNTGQELFFHRSSVEGTTFEDLKEGQRISYVLGQGPKGPRAESVKPA
ncbi:MAG: cold shock domain-containing protein [Polyangiaceae bacterium]|nr:cold shock domain-containing protein [Polyangiaceae bacterium]